MFCPCKRVRGTRAAEDIQKDLRLSKSQLGVLVTAPRQGMVTRGCLSLGQPPRCLSKDAVGEETSRPTKEHPLLAYLLESEAGQES